MPNYIHYRDTPEKIQEINKKYYEKNRDKIIEYLQTKTTCECGKVLCIAAMSKHKKSKIHQKSLLTSPDVSGHASDSC